MRKNSDLPSSTEAGFQKELKRLYIGRTNGKTEPKETSSQTYRNRKAISPGVGSGPGAILYAVRLSKPRRRCTEHGQYRQDIEKGFHRSPGR